MLLLHNVNPAWSPAEKTAAITAAEYLSVELSREGHPVESIRVTDPALAEVLQSFNPEEFIVFNWCEELPGRSRSEAEVVRILDELNFIYTGSSHDVLSFSWDKAATKELLHQHNIPTPAWGVFDDGSGVDHWECFPAIVKPAFEHCSLGITAESVVMDSRALKSRVAFVHDTFEQPAIVEDFIDGREFHVTLLGNGFLRALPAAEMSFNALDNMTDRLCTFDSKFTLGSLHYEKIELLVPAPLEEAQMRSLNRTATEAYRAMRCRDYARIDLRMRGGLYYVLDINPNPDLSPDTSMVYAANAAGLSYGIFASSMVNLAAQRHPVFSV